MDTKTTDMIDRFEPGKARYEQGDAHHCNTKWEQFTPRQKRHYAMLEAPAVRAFCDEVERISKRNMFKKLNPEQAKGVAMKLLLEEYPK